ncbi:MAG: Nramp family divalent metal transporter [Bacteroidota bacterium]
MNKKKQIGPAAMVAAAFIGPGTVTTASLAGANFGYVLLWTILFATLATIILQEMAARIGVVAQMGLGEAVRTKIRQPVQFGIAAFLIVSAIFFGNVAYEAGNITGALLAIPPQNLSIGSFQLNIWVLLLGGIAFILLWQGTYKLIERFLIILVGVMSLVFLLTAIILQPDLSAILSGLFVPNIPEGSLLIVLGLIGTTIVPYNLFLHAASARDAFEGPEDLASARKDTYLSVSIGGIITMAIILCSAVVIYGQGKEFGSIADLATQLEPVLGSWSSTFLALGFLAAGLSSTITAPLATAYAISGILGWSRDMKSQRFRIIWITVLLSGLTFALAGFKPIPLILFAQVANGILLPVIVGFLLWIMNDKQLLKDYVNSRRANLLGIVIFLITLALGSRSILKVVGLI